MKRILLGAITLLAIQGASAQKFDDVTKSIQTAKWSEARAAIDKMSADPKATAKPEYWYYRAQAYANLGNSAQDSALLSMALESLNKYYAYPVGKRGDKDVMILMDNNNTLVNLYSSYFNSGIKAYQDKRWVNSYNNFRSALSTFELLKSNKLTTAPIDTNATLYSGIAAQNGGMKNEAAVAYASLIDRGVKNPDYAELYEFLLIHHLDKKDNAAFQKYLGLARAEYPKRDWLQFELQTLPEEKMARRAALKELLSRNPNSYELSLNYAVELFNDAWKTEAGKDNTALKAETTEALKTTIAAQPADAHYAHYIMAQHYTNMISENDEAIRKIKGVKPEDIKKKAAITAKSAEIWESVGKYAQTAYDAYTAMGTDLKNSDKAYLRQTVLMLADYHTVKKDAAKAKMYNDKLKTLQ